LFYIEGLPLLCRLSYTTHSLAVGAFWFGNKAKFSKLHVSNFLVGYQFAGGTLSDQILLATLGLRDDYYPFYPGSSANLHVSSRCEGQGDS
jgi:hypothetical protein